MKKALFITMAVVIIISAVCSAYAGNGPHGAAPNSGDGIPDGSGMEGSFGPYGK